MCISYGSIGASNRTVLGREEGDLDVAQLWSWKAEGPPYQLEVRKVDEQHWKARVRGPKATKTAVLAVPVKPVSKP